MAAWCDIRASCPPPTIPTTEAVLRWRCDVHASMNITAVPGTGPGTGGPSGTIDQVAVRRTGAGDHPQPDRSIAIKHRELVKFAVVGGATWVIDTGRSWYSRALSWNRSHYCEIIAVLMATIVSYVLNREWSFRMRAGGSATTRPRCSSSSAGCIAVYTAPAISRYVFHLSEPTVSLLTSRSRTSSGEIRVIAGMAFRWWASQVRVPVRARSAARGSEPSVAGHRRRGAGRAFLSGSVSAVSRPAGRQAARRPREPRAGRS